MLTLGANGVGNGQTRFRVWAPSRASVEVCLETVNGTRYVPLTRDPEGYFEGVHPASAGMRYRYRLDAGDCYPDPCSRFQPQGPHGPSEIVDPTTFEWTDSAWKGLGRRGQVYYELHVGAFSPRGDYGGVIAQLPHLKELGVTTLELMPLHSFPGRFNWGYDGVNLFAPTATYGSPDDLRRLVNEAHRHGLGIILDVVYNHLGPDGNYLSQFSKSYFSDKYPKEWGDPPNFDGPQSGPVRDFFIQNAAYWISEFHFDGLRLDATQSLYDASKRHIVADLATAAREAAPGRGILVVAENEPQDVRMVNPQAQGGNGADAMWVDDFHHSARVAASGNAEAYLQDYRGTAQELLSCALRNSLFQGQYYAWQRKPRGSRLLSTPPDQIVFFLQNHDQIANNLRGQRIHCVSSPSFARALTTYFLLLPQTPLLFMGQEFFSSKPFFYFVDHKPDLQAQVNAGRDRFVGQFASAHHAIQKENHRITSGEEALSLSRLDWTERERNRPALMLHQELLRLRREDPVFAAQELCRLAGAVLSSQTLVLRYLGDEQLGERLLIFNLGAEFTFEPCSEPLLAPFPGTVWHPLLSSEEARFGGQGARFPPQNERGWRLPGQCTLVLSSKGVDTRGSGGTTA